MHDSARIAKNHRSKADVYVLYDHTEGGVYFVDLVSTYHSIRMRHERCLVNTLAFARTWYRYKKTETILVELRFRVQMLKFDFTYQLKKSLDIEIVQRWYTNLDGCSKDLIRKIKTVWEISEGNSRPTKIK